jgi:hypothetical protein
LNSSPFSLDTQFLPEDAGEDKIDLDLGKWRVFGLTPGDDVVEEFKSYLSSPPEDEEDFAWESTAVPGAPPLYGAFLCRLTGKENRKFSLRKQAVIHPTDSRRIEPPLCSGSCRFRLDSQRLPVTGEFIHSAKLYLSLNLQRFIRHQPPQDNPKRPHTPRLQRRKDKRCLHGDEQSFDGQDNWLPDTPEWRKYATKEHLPKYLELIGDQMGKELSRACEIIQKSVLQIDPEADWERIAWDREDSYSLSQVETLWEFPADNPIATVWELGTKLMHLSKTGGKVAMHEMQAKEAGHIYNSPCFSIPVAENVRLKLYAKTNKRIRFEIVHSELWNQRAALLKEAGLKPETGGRSWDDIPHMLKALRQRAAKHMNNVMEHLQTVQTPGLKPKTLLELIATVFEAIPPTIFKQTRMDRIQTMLIWLCFHKGYRGGIKKGPYSDALKILAERGIIQFDHKRKFYVLTNAYKDAAAALSSIAGDPLLALMGIDPSEFVLQPSSLSPPVRLRE